MSEPLVIPLVAPLATRYQSLTVDPRMINAFSEKNAIGEFHVYKRPGFSRRSSAIPAGVPRGLFNWRERIYAIVGNVIYRDGVALAGTIDITAGPYSFAAGLGGAPKLFLHNTQFGYVIDEAGTVTTITNTNFPPLRIGPPARSLVWGSVYLDGVFYVCTNLSEAANSESDPSAPYNDPLVWEPGYLGVESEGNDAVAIARQLVYILVIKRYFTEALYNAGAPDPGSPLGFVQGAKMNLGLRDFRTLCDCGGDLLFVAQTREGSVSVVRITQLSPQMVSTPPVERILEAADYTTVYSWSVKIEGHRMYGLTFPVSNITLVYDITSNLWYQWTDTNGNYLPYAYATNDTNNRTLFLHESNGRTYNLDPLVTTDDGALFSCEVYTPNLSQDGRTKITGRMDLIGDRVPGSTVEVRWSDDDYSTFSQIETLDMSLERPSIADLGSFFRRAFHLKHRAATVFRVEKAVIYTKQGA